MAPKKISARELIGQVFDADSFVSWDTVPIDVSPDPKYRAELDAAAVKSGTDESVITGTATLGGRRVAVIACEFAFLAGSIGVAASERIVTAIERATAEGLPLLASPTSGGTRMQEGTLAFVQMVKIAAAIAAHKAAHLPYLVYLRNPTTGGVFASWGSLGHVTIAEPGALVGFLGPRVYEALYGEKFPEGVQTSENLYRNGVIDGVASTTQLRDLVERALHVLVDPADPLDTSTDPVAEQDVPDVPAWQSVMISRRADRPGIRELVRHATSTRVPLSGTGQGEVDSTVLLSLARFQGQPCVLFGQDRAGQSALNTMGPAALREARRGMRMAAELRLPLVLVIDTLGAALSKEAEERGLAPEIARCISDLVTLRTPTVSVLLGQGTGGGALALLPADRVLAAQNGWLAPLPPEGASAIVHRDTSHAPQMAAAQGIRARDLLRDGVVDGVIPERPDAALEPVEFSRRVGAAIARELVALGGMSGDDRIAARVARYRTLGLPAS
ncbi:acetyl-CoA carboxylase carboxyl transferase subunit beta [Rhodococcus sp. AG1013]|uniref:acetyl-coenzyme A carboxylase carboxyl transferase subunits beta/alpha n=1 Tax=Rhodococcus sp. AG1013 TaxID=2183996 RepID=UPI000E0C1424|nr:carboxyl transferase domain-containing protein [Rhodococcus sp. AG1013]RDI20541.1 acetyl-CoA carboxylase carboxyl transferase subunit beta [Rhodococcus sp. AG1013]